MEAKAETMLIDVIQFSSSGRTISVCVSRFVDYTLTRSTLRDAVTDRKTVDVN